MPIRVGANPAKVIMLGTVPVKKVFLGATQIWANEVIAYIGGGTVSPVMRNYFTADDWANPYLRKRLIIAPGSEVGASNGSYAIATTGSAEGTAGSFAGELVLDIYGTVSGIGGAANSGKGGDVIWGNFPGRDGQKAIVNLHPGGILRSGAGGGGRAGNGGPGTYNYTARDPASGEHYTGPISGATGGVTNNPGGTAYTSYSFYSSNHDTESRTTTIAWGGGWILRGANDASTRSSFGYGSQVAFNLPITVGIYTYYQGTMRVAGSYGNSASQYGIYRTWTASAGSAGGVAGNAGRGRGYDGAATAGAAPVAGGTNAGASGKSGDGGDWGQPGQAGANGAAGNAGAGTAGAAGGLAGFYINGLANIQFNNLGGTVLGRVA